MRQTTLALLGMDVRCRQGKGRSAAPSAAAAPAEAEAAATARVVVDYYNIFCVGQTRLLSAGIYEDKPWE